MSAIQPPCLWAFHKERSSKENGQEDCSTSSLLDVNIFSKFLELETKDTRPLQPHTLKSHLPKKVVEENTQNPLEKTPSPFDHSLLHEDDDVDVDVPFESHDPQSPTLQNITMQKGQTRPAPQENTNPNNRPPIQGAAHMESGALPQPTPLLFPVPLQFLDATEILETPKEKTQTPNTQAIGLSVKKEEEQTASFQQGAGGFDTQNGDFKPTNSTTSTAEEKIRQTQIIQQILADFKGQLGQLYKSTSHFSVHLNHQSLGRLDVGIKIKDNKVLDANFQTESLEAAQTLSQYKKEIEAIFKDYGLETTNQTIRIYGLQEI